MRRSREGRPRESERAAVRLGHWRADGAAKVRFRSEGEANRAALQFRLEHGSDLSAYPCGVCGGWHLGNARG